MTLLVAPSTNLKSVSDPYRTVVYHCGAAGGMHRSYERFPLPLCYISFDPNSQSQGELQRQKRRESSPWIKHDVIPAAVDYRNGKRRFLEYKPSDLSSFLTLNKDISWRYRRKRVSLLHDGFVPCRSIDSVSKERNEPPTFICLDIQGWELQALRGASRVLENDVLGVRCEVNFLKLYRRMPSLDQISTYMETRGFLLARLEKCGSGLAGPSTDCGPFSRSWDDARPAWADAIYIKGPPKMLRLLAAAPEPAALLAKYLAFCFMNSSHSLGLDLLHELSKSRFSGALAAIPAALRVGLVRTIYAHLRACDSARLGHTPLIDRQYRSYRMSLKHYLDDLLRS